MNPASIKQVLVETSELVNSAGIFEQGFGKINMVAAYEALSLYSPRASVIPSSLDFTECPYMWPFCAQPMFVSLFFFSFFCPFDFLFTFYLGIILPSQLLLMPLY